MPIATSPSMSAWRRLYNTEPGTQLRIDAVATYGWVGHHDGFISSTDNNTCNPVAQG